MRKLFIILLLLPCFSFGQKKDSLTSKAVLMTVTSVYPSNYLWAVSSSPSKQDTIPVIMLVCDTLWANKTFTYTNTKADIDFQIDMSNEVKWQFGYEVYGKEDPTCTKCWMNTLFIGYLDQNKKPLSKSIVVWMTKELTNHHK